MQQRETLKYGVYKCTGFTVLLMIPHPCLPKPLHRVHALMHEMALLLLNIQASSLTSSMIIKTATGGKKRARSGLMQSSAKVLQ